MLSLVTMEFIKFANVLVLNKDGLALVLRRTASHPTRPLMPDLPGGRVELGESFEATAIREVREETCIKLREEDLTLIDDTELSLPERSLHGVLYKALLKTKNISITLSDEHDEYYWTKPEELSGLSDFHKKSIENALLNNLLGKSS